MSIEKRLQELDLVLPAQPQLPPGLELPFKPIMITGNTVYVSGIIALSEDGNLKEPLGRVGSDLSLEQGVEAARSTALAMISVLKHELGDLNRIKNFVKVLGMVNGSPDFYNFPSVINGFSNLILHVFGPEAGAHARSAVGVGGLPFNTPVEIEAILELKDFRK